MGVKQPWFVFSSSSGETFEKLYNSLSSEAKNSLQGFYVDRECGAFERAQKILGSDKVKSFSKKEFETLALKILKSSGHSQAVILLCGFFGILTKTFLDESPFAILNTHPSLLPAFPGLDKKVHQAVFEQAHFSGFTLHLVNESLDGGAIVFQKSLSIKDTKTWEECRDKVRALEQSELPKAWDKVLECKIRPEDRHVTARQLIQKYNLIENLA